jgi:pSer/pThr/pTyr-binding forkhead associated (FHA) protein
MAEFQFVMRSGPTPGKIYPIEGNELTVGRESNNSIAINDAEVSRKHARLEKRGTSYVIQDLGSTNGTFVNGVRISGIQVLNAGDEVSFGENILLMYEAVVDPNATMVSSPKPAKTEMSPQRPVVAAPPAAPASSRPAAAVPGPAYSGKVPAGPVSSPASKSNSKIILIIIAVVVLCIIAGCIGTLAWIDADPTGARWCQYLPFIARLFGGVCP